MDRLISAGAGFSSNSCHVVPPTILLVLIYSCGYREAVGELNILPKNPTVDAAVRARPFDLRTFIPLLCSP